MIINKHNQELISILENEKISRGFLKILIFQVSIPRTHLQSKTILFCIQSYIPVMIFSRVLCVTISFHHLVCVCALYLSCVYVVKLSYHHSIIALFTNHSPSHSFHLPWSISLMLLIIVHQLSEPIIIVHHLFTIFGHTHVTLSFSLTFTID